MSDLWAVVGTAPKRLEVFAAEIAAYDNCMLEVRCVTTAHDGWSVVE